MNEIKAWAGQANGTLELISLDWQSLAAEDVEVEVEHCGLCHSDLSMLHNDWGITRYPIVPGHEAVGRIVAMGEAVKGLKLGQRVGIGWHAGSCMHCETCIAGEPNLCTQAQPTINGHTGGFAQRIRAHWLWAIPLPDALDMAATGPLLCGGITVFSPFLLYGIKPTDRVGVVGIGGLGHMALKFARAWGCEVTAFTSHESKTAEAIAMGAHHVVSSRDSQAWQAIARSLDFLLVTVNVALDWGALLKTLKPNGRLHVVGAVLEPIPVPVFELLLGQKSVSSSPTGSPSALALMLEFAARHNITPQVEHFPMSRINDALEHLRAGKARYRIVLDNDWQ